MGSYEKIFKAYDIRGVVPDELDEQIAESVGVGALKYGDLSVARDSSYVLDFDRLLAEIAELTRAY